MLASHVRFVLALILLPALVSSACTDADSGASAPDSMVTSTSVATVASTTASPPTTPI